ncbi:MAG: flagellar protein FlgN [Thermodesulfovibrio sp.]|nr:flagellar protein FlgN [Thermodesulfovibrio sp.]
MTNLLNRLLEILTKEKECLSELYNIVSEERDTIVSLRHHELERILRKKEETVMKISLLEKEREKFLLENELNGLSLSEIIKKYEIYEETSKLKELYTTIKTLLTAIEEIQRINEQLIDHCLFNIHRSLKFLENFNISAKSTISKEV